MLSDRWHDLVETTRTDSAVGITYAALGISSEAGEVANEAKKIIRNDNGSVTIERRNRIIDELGDLLWYTHLMMIELQVDEYEVFGKTQSKLLGRKENNTIKER